MRSAQQPLILGYMNFSILIDPSLVIITRVCLHFKPKKKQKKQNSNTPGPQIYYYDCIIIILSADALPLSKYLMYRLKIEGIP